MPKIPKPKIEKPKQKTLEENEKKSETDKTDQKREKITFRDLFLLQLTNILSAENQLVEVLPTLVESATTLELIEGFQNHLEETKHQVDRLNQIFKILDERPTDEICKAMKGLIDDGNELLKENMLKLNKDSALIAISLRIEHYEMAVYKTLIDFAKQLSLDEVVTLLQESYKEESHANLILTQLGEGSLFKAGINKLARDDV